MGQYTTWQFGYQSCLSHHAIPEARLDLLVRLFGDIARVDTRAKERGNRGNRQARQPDDHQRQVRVFVEAGRDGANEIRRPNIAQQMRQRERDSERRCPQQRRRRVG